MVLDNDLTVAAKPLETCTFVCTHAAMPAFWAALAPLILCESPVWTVAAGRECHQTRLGMDQHIFIFVAAAGPIPETGSAGIRAKY
jgi:hypothetical protein